MSNIVTSILFSIGFGGFVYYKMMHQTGGNTKNSVIVAALGALVGFFVVFTIFGTFFGN